MRITLLILAASVIASGAIAQTIPVKAFATVETEPAPVDGDAADDPAIWIHPKDPAKSLVLGTNKAGGLMVFGMDGKRKQYFDGIQPNNVDVRGGFVRDGKTVGLAVASERKANTLAAWTIDPDTSELTPLAVRSFTPKVDVYGFCLARDDEGGLYGVVTSKAGTIEQWRLEAQDEGKALAATLAATRKVPGKCEGCVADDERGFFYVSEEEGGLWELPIAPTSSVAPKKIADIVPKGPLVPDVEGVTLFAQGETGGYLIVSCQGNSTFAVFERAGKHAYLGAFRVFAENGADPVTETDGIDVVQGSAGPGFEQGLFVTQDDNERANQNFKFVPWQNIAEALKSSTTKKP